MHQHLSEVGIVGAGPVGLVLALTLGRLGVSTTVYEADDGPRVVPRGSTHNSRTMEHYRSLGLARDVETRGLPAGHSAGISFREAYSGRILADVDWPNAVTGGSDWRAAQPVVSRSPERMLRANQCRVEPLLFDAAVREPLIDLRLNRRVVGLAESRDHVAITSQDRSGSDPQRGRHLFVVGCDGARSVVRDHIGARLHGGSALPVGVLGAGSTAAHVRVTGLAGQGRGQARRWGNWVFNREVAFNLIALDGEDQYSLLTGALGTEATPHQVGQLVLAHSPRGVEVEVLDVRRWEGGVALVADRYGAGKVFLAGDAAHLFTPHGGFGMNTGVDDAVNLAWKLAAVVRGWARPRLLETYEAERRPVAEQNTTRAREFGRQLARIPRTGPGVGKLLGAYATATIDTDDVAFGANYSESALTSRAFDDGTRAPHFWLSTDRRDAGDSLLDHLGEGLTLVHRPRDEETAKAAMRETASLRIPIATVAMTADPVRDAYGSDFALLRPDGHAIWVGNHLGSADLVGAIERVSGSSVVVETSR